MGGAQQLVKLAGASVGLGLAIAAAAPFSGVPPRGTSGDVAPAQIQVKVLAAGEFTVDPLGEVLKPTPFPGPGERGGPAMQVTLRNITGLTASVAVRLQSVAPELSDAVTVRASVAGAVVLNGSLRSATEWSIPAGRLPSGKTSTLRIRFRLRPGLDPDDFAGRLDIRQLEIKGVRPGQRVEEPTTPQVVPSPSTPTTPATTPTASTPAPSTPQPPAPSRPKSPADGPKRFAPDEGSE